MSVRHPWAAGVVLCVALVSTACDVKVGESGLSVDFAGSKATDEWVRSYDIQPGGRLESRQRGGVARDAPEGGDA